MSPIRFQNVKSGKVRSAGGVDKKVKLKGLKVEKKLVSGSGDQKRKGG